MAKGKIIADTVPTLTEEQRKRLRDPDYGVKEIEAMMRGEPSNIVRVKRPTLEEIMARKPSKKPSP